MQRNLNRTLFGNSAVDVKTEREPSVLDSFSVGQTTSESLPPATASPPILTQNELELLNGENGACVEQTSPSTGSIYFNASSIKKERLDAELLESSGSSKQLPAAITNKNASLSDSKLSPEELLPQEQLDAAGTSLKGLSAKSTPVNLRERNAMMAEFGNCSPFNLPYPEGKTSFKMHRCKSLIHPLGVVGSEGNAIWVGVGFGGKGCSVRIELRKNSCCDLCTLRQITSQSEFLLGRSLVDFVECSDSCE